MLWVSVARGVGSAGGAGVSRPRTDKADSWKNPAIRECGYQLDSKMSSKHLEQVFCRVRNLSWGEL